jgi:hypothetical protein
MRLKKGDRVQIRGGQGWPQGATGVVTSTMPTTLGGGVLEAFRRRWRVVRGFEPVIVKYDEAQIGGDGDGPYLVACMSPSELARLA